MPIATSLHHSPRMTRFPNVLAVNKCDTVRAIAKKLIGRFTNHVVRRVLRPKKKQQKQQQQHFTHDEQETGRLSSPSSSCISITGNALLEFRGSASSNTRKNQRGDMKVNHHTYNNTQTSQGNKSKNKGKPSSNHYSDTCIHGETRRVYMEMEHPTGTECSNKIVNRELHFRSERLPCHYLIALASIHA